MMPHGARGARGASGHRRAAAALAAVLAATMPLPLWLHHLPVALAG